MPTEVIMPKVDMDMDRGKVVAWHVKEGEPIEKGAPLFDIETDKAAMEVESPVTGTLHYVIGTEGMDIPIGEPVAWIYADGEEVGPPPAALSQVGAPVEQAAAPVVAKTTVAPPTDKLRASPRARREAKGRGIDLASIAGSGLNGRIQFADLPATSASPLSIITKGSGNETPLVLIHGLAADAGGWALLEKHLSKSRPIHKIELPAHGASPNLAIKSFDDLTEITGQALDSLGLQSAHLLGHSLGGAVAIALAKTRAATLSTVTAIAPAGLGQEINRDLLTTLLEASDADALAEPLKALVADPAIISDNYARSAFSRRSNPSLRDAQRALANAIFPSTAQAFDLTQTLRSLTTSTRLIWGRQDAVVPWEHALSAPGHVSLNLFDRTGHLPHIERPAEIAALL